MTDSADGRRGTADSSTEAADTAGSDAGDSEEVVVERLPPDEAFELLAHETRFRILETLNDADGALSFSDLRKRVGVRDAGQFNYHLGKVTGRFVSDGEDGYELAPPGRRIVGAVLSGGYTKAIDVDSVEMDATCLACGGPMAAEFRIDGVEIQCQECEFTYTNTTVPAGVLQGLAPEAAPGAVDRWLKRIHAAADYGFCFNCNGQLEQNVRLEGEEDAPDWLEWDGPEEVEGDGPDATIEYECQRCGRSWFTSVMFAAAFHPAIVGLHYEHDVDVHETPLWDLDWMTGGASALELRDPVRIDVTVTLDDETAVFTFDEELNVVEERRE